MKKLVLGFVCIFALWVLTISTVSAQSFSDRDWSTGVTANCGLPRAVEGRKSAAWTRVSGDRKLVFTLHPGQVGTCSTDNMARHSAPFWERVEVRQRGYFDFKNPTRIEFEATFLSGFASARETFFQIHGWNDGCPAYPPLMMQVDRGVIQVRPLTNVRPTAGQEWISKDQGYHKSRQTTSVRVANIFGEPQKFQIEVTPFAPSKARLTVLINGRALVENTVMEYAPCAKPHFKFGLYRPGGSKAVSQIMFDDVKIK